MKTKIFNFLFSSTFTNNKVKNFTWLIFRLHVGLSMALHAGLPKIKNIVADDWFVKQVGEIGFTFPSPTFWATIASWGEFLGGLFIAFGFFTRFSAIQLAFQFFVVSFIWYDKPEPLTGMYFQQLLFWAFILISVFGAGKYSIDERIVKNKLKTNAKKPIAIIAMFIIFSSCNAQNGPLKGNGNLIAKSFEFKKFDKLNLQDLDGKINIHVGKPFSVEIAIDENLEKLLMVEENNGTLKVYLKGNNNNKLYIENTNIAVSISLPNITFLNHNGNSTVTVKDISSENFKVKIAGNGTVNLFGKINNLEITARGNSSLHAEKLIANNIEITRSGNGNVYINTDSSFNASVSGNSSIFNNGKGKVSNASTITGNGKVRYPKDEKLKDNENEMKTEKVNKVNVVFINKKMFKMNFTIVYPISGSFGISVAANSTITEKLPLGTKVYKGNKNTFKKPLLIITKNNQELIIK